MIEMLKGCEEMQERPSAKKVAPLSDYRLSIEFDNGEHRIFDVKPMLINAKGTWFGELLNEDYFKRVRIGGLSVEWPNEQDICPDQLYYDSKPN